MTEKEIGTQPEVTVEELKSKIAELESVKENLVGEIKDVRTKRQEKDAEIEELQSALTLATKAKAETPKDSDVQSLVEEAVTRALHVTEASKAKDNQKVAFEKFISEHKEFSPDNDITGKLREALEAEFNSFKTDGVVEQDDFYKLIRKAHGLMGVDTTLDTSKKEIENPYSSIPNTTITPKTENSTTLTQAEQRLVYKNGWDEARYLKLKAKNPAYMESLLQYV